MNDSSIPQLHTRNEEKLEAPKHLWRTVLGRAVFGFTCEIDNNPNFVNDEYIAALCNVQNSAERQLGKLTVYSAAFSLFAIATTQGNIDNVSYLGFQISNIPFLTEFCSLVIGVLVTLFAFLQLDILAMTRMRLDLFSLTGTEHPHMRMLHLKGSGAWIDVLTPKQVGYQSNFFHRLIQLFGLLWALVFPLAVLSVLLSAQAICVASFWPIFELNLSNAISGTGIILSSSSLLLVAVVTLVPLRFTLQPEEIVQEPPAEANTDNQ